MTNSYWATEYVLTVGLGLTVLFAWLGWTSSRQATTGTRVVCAALRGMAAVGLVLLALNPGKWQQPASESLPTWHFLADGSRSMAEKDCNGVSRRDAALRRISWYIDELPAKVPAEVETFADVRTRVPSLDELEKIAPDGTASDILGAVGAILRAHMSAPGALGGIVLASDGIQVPGGNVQEVAGLALALDVPIFAACTGGDVAVPDMELRPERVTVPAFVGQPLRIPFRVKATGLGRISAEIRAEDESGEPRAAISVRLEDGVERRCIAECGVPEEPGYVRFKLASRVFPGEAAVLNNQLEIGVQVLDSAVRILMVEGLPHWDSKFLAQLLRARDYIQLTEIYRLGPSRYYRIDPEGEKLDQEGPGMFPGSISELAEYDAVVLGKGIDAVLSPAQVAVLRTFVADRGGALIFARGRPWRDTFPELAEIEPIVWGESLDGHFSMRPTTAGTQTGLFGEKLPAADSQVWGMLPVIDQLYDVQRVKPFTRVLARVQGDDIPLIASRRFGRGMVVSVNAEGLWQWDFFPQVEESRSVYREFWPLLVQWALTSADFPPGCQLVARAANPVVRVGEPAEFALFARSADSIPDDIHPRLQIRSGSGPVRSLDVQPSMGEEGRWSAGCTFDTPGLYEIRPDVDGVTAVAGAGVEVLPLPGENDRLSADRRFLTDLCELTGGKLLAGDDPDWPPEDLARSVEELGTPVWVPLWDRGWWLAAICVAMAVEWYVRRRSMLS